MKNLKPFLLASLAVAVLPLSAAQYVFVPGNDRLETKVCIAAAENNLSKYKSRVRLLSNQKKPQYRVVARKLTCNDQNLASFARQYNADETASFISRYSNHEVIIRREISHINEQLITPELDSDKVIYVTVN